MKRLNLFWGKGRSPIPYWILGIAASLLAIYLGLVWKSEDTAHLGMSVLFLAAAGMLFWDKRNHLKFGSTLIAQLTGILITLCLFWQSTVLYHDPFLTDNLPDPMLRIFPFLAAFSLALFASGFRGVRQYWQELTILFFLGIPSILTLFLPDISPITAKFSGFLLWYTGFNVSINDVFINLPTGSVEVYRGCSGIESMTYLLGISIVGLVMFPISPGKRFFVPFLAVLIGFLVNSIRVALMAILAASNQKSAFVYWHEGSGSLVFGAIAIFAFWVVYQLLLKQEKYVG